MANIEVPLSKELISLLTPDVMRNRIYTHSTESIKRIFAYAGVDPEDTVLAEILDLSNNKYLYSPEDGIRAAFKYDHYSMGFDKAVAGGRFYIVSLYDPQNIWNIYCRETGLICSLCLNYQPCWETGDVQLCDHCNRRSTEDIINHVDRGIQNVKRSRASRFIQQAHKPRHGERRRRHPKNGGENPTAIPKW